MKRILATILATTLFGATAGVVFFALWKFVPVDDWIATAQSSDDVASRDSGKSDSPSRDEELPDGFAPIDQREGDQDESQRDRTAPAPSRAPTDTAPPREQKPEPSQPLIVVDDGTFGTADELAFNGDGSGDDIDSAATSKSTTPQPEPAPAAVAEAPSDPATASKQPAVPATSDIDGASLLAALERAEAAKASSTNTSGQSATSRNVNNPGDNSPPHVAGAPRVADPSPPAPASQPSPRNDADFKDLNSQLDEMSKALERFNDKLKQRLSNGEK